MRSTFVLLLLLAVVCLSSCISTKQLTYLQEDAQVDSLITIQKKQEPYRLQVNDLLSIRVKALDPELVDIFNPVGETNPNATGEQRLYYDGFVVDPHGNIRVPILGEINVLGHTVDEVRKDIEARLLRDYFKAEANVFVTVKLSGIRYTIAGEINGSGSNIIYRDEVTIMEAIANSGGVPITGDLTDVIVIRQYPAGQKVHHIDLTNINAMHSPYYQVKPNDLILINPLPEKALGTGTTGLQSFTTILSVVTALTTVILLFIRL
ncbi:polysaccharide biosynthesis/export family protein [Altibacter sp.]|uniref:polysaccharide biosynthesis/export family protein n=1 Tax=Altibacter sp. TaxID=2024823 RepID=UPI000C96FB62|nr:polysaccharide biosynthesis/export family protein [Altibacter sp.]MAP54558.1 sugar transporter [Altibacter sp.]